MPAIRPGYAARGAASEAERSKPASFANLLGELMGAEGAEDVSMDDEGEFITELLTKAAVYCVRWRISPKKHVNKKNKKEIGISLDFMKKRYTMSACT